MITLHDLQRVAATGQVAQFNTEPVTYRLVGAGPCDGHCDLPAGEPCAGMVTADDENNRRGTRHVGANGRIREVAA